MFILINVHTTSNARITRAFGWSSYTSRWEKTHLNILYYVQEKTRKWKRAKKNGVRKKHAGERRIGGGEELIKNDNFPTAAGRLCITGCVGWCHIYFLYALLNVDARGQSSFIILYVYIYKQFVRFLFIYIYVYNLINYIFSRRFLCRVHRHKDQ